MNDKRLSACSGVSTPFRSSESGDFSIRRLTPQDITFKHRDGHKRLKNYYLGELLGEGSYGKVKEVLDPKTKRRFAVKILTKKKLRNIPGGESGLLREIEIMKKINNRQCTQFVDYWTDEEQEKSYLVLEYLGGGSLGELLHRAPHKSLPLRQARRVFKQLLKALEYIHSIGIVHRDVKPDNIMLTISGDVKLSDFGVSKMLNPEDSPSYNNSRNISANNSKRTSLSSSCSNITTSPLQNSEHEQHKPLQCSTPTPSSAYTSKHNSMSFHKSSSMNSLSQCSMKEEHTAGSPAFQPPEIASGKTNFSGPAMDVWAAGIVLYIMVFGKYPFETEGNNVRALFEHIAECSYTIPEDNTDPQLESLIRGILEPDPEKRLSIAQIKLHPWMTKKLSKKDEWVPVQIPHSAFSKFAGQCKDNSNCIIS